MNAKAVAPANGEDILPDGSVRVPLSRDLKIPTANGIGTTKLLIFREPNGEDIELAGCPVIIDADSQGNPKVLLDEPKVNAMLARLSGIPLPFIRKLHSRDWMNCAWAISPFFVPGA